MTSTYTPRHRAEEEKIIVFQGEELSYDDVVEGWRRKPAFPGEYRAAFVVLVLALLCMIARKFIF